MVYNHLTHAYQWLDGTFLPAEIVDTAHNGLDLMYMVILRDQQRKEPK
jgi:hypothetical protein